MMEYNSYLRPVAYTDLELIYTWRNQEEIRSLMFQRDPIDWSTHVNWFSFLQKDEHNVIKLFVEDNEPRGVVQVNNINRNDQTAEWGFYIGDQYKKGLGTLLAYHALHFIFQELQIRKLTAQVLSTNPKSINFHSKIGFEQEGILRKQIKRDKQFIDVHLFAQFEHDWERNKLKLMEGYNHV
ncbi:UDP-4-amino-4,6-dideoxy-N-acetyl-beta-L-altrosamine N-acetyltransferase [Virgibacillus flavescens]|uniref:UDP-4-amino-4, 6-dideoxy-N-acetyl-beta-L-altrosamine N-acetyltransferase n=1 Tax=Virgibacillus flavescens TaxID=1611422 RepID=UPI003D326088